jgi:hypothetical protein
MRRAMTSFAHESDDEEVLAHRVRRDPNFCMLDETRPRLFVRGCFETCAVCLEEIVDAVTIAPCGHGTCAGCDARLPLTDIRVCVMCKARAPRSDYCTYELPPAMRARHAEFEADMVKLGTIAPAPRSLFFSAPLVSSVGPTGPNGLPSGPSGPSVAKYGQGRGNSVAATLVDIAPIVVGPTGPPTEDAVIFVLDASGSMATMDAWDTLAAQFPRVVDSMTGTTFALIVFNDTPRVVVPPRRLEAGDGRFVAEQLAAVRADGTTELHTALELAENLAAPMGGTAVPRVVLVTDGDATDTKAARRVMGEMKTPVFAVGFGSAYDYDRFAALCADVRGKGNSSTMFEHAATVEKLVECVLEPRSMCTFRLVLSAESGLSGLSGLAGLSGLSGLSGPVVVFFNGETREMDEDGTVEGSFVRSAGTRVAVVAPTLVPFELFVGGRGCRAVAVEHDAAMGAEVRRFVQATRAMEYVMSLSVRVPKHDVHTHAGLLGRTRAALREIGPTMSGVIEVIDERMAAMRETRGCDSNTVARAASCAVRALTSF